MSIITISRGSYSKGKQVAEKLAERLKYDCLSRNVIINASEQFNIEEGKLARALHDSPSFVDRITYGREKYIAFIQQAFLAHIRKDNVVYHGLAGHFFLKDAPNVLKVRIIANMQERIREEMRRENISEHDARRLLIKDDHDRRRWGEYFYGVDTRDPNLYDLVIHIDKLDIDAAVDLIIQASQLPAFQSNEQSQSYIEDLYMAAQAQARLITLYPTIKITCDNKVLRICCKGSWSNDQTEIERINAMLSNIEGVRGVEYASEPILVPD